MKRDGFYTGSERGGKKSRRLSLLCRVTFREKLMTRKEPAEHNTQARGLGIFWAPAFSCRKRTDTERWPKQTPGCLCEVLLLGKIEDKRRRGWQSMRWLDVINRLNGHEFEQAPGVGDGQGSLTCCSSWGRKVLDTTEWLNWTDESKIKILAYITSLWILQRNSVFYRSTFKWLPAVLCSLSCRHLISIFIFLVAQYSSFVSVFRWPSYKLTSHARVGAFPAIEWLHVN